MPLIGTNGQKKKKITAVKTNEHFCASCNTHEHLTFYFTFIIIIRDHRYLYDVTIKRCCRDVS